MKNTTVTFKTLPTKYGSFESANLVVSVYRKAGIEAHVVPGRRGGFTVRIYTITEDK
jgi:hypothetical protein